MGTKAQVARHKSQGVSCNARLEFFCLLPFALCLALAGAGCGKPQLVVYEDNYLTYNHPFSDDADLAVRRNAEKLCAQRKQAAVKTRSACSMKECTTHYQCVDKTEN
ncbi:MAG TPA: hypothetical protein VFO57_11985 [Burkholderiales bacterium]|nr:hypothetical protein [Burkholderiales bacterium]